MEHVDLVFSFLFGLVLANIIFVVCKETENYKDTKKLDYEWQSIAKYDYLRAIQIHRKIYNSSLIGAKSAVDAYISKTTRRVQ